MWMPSQANQPIRPLAWNRPNRDHRATAGEVGRRSEVAVAEGFRGLGRRRRARTGVDPPPDPPGGVVPRLHRDLGDARELVEAHQVPDHRDLRMSGDREVRLTDDAPGPVLLGPGGLRQHAGERRCRRRRRSTGRCRPRTGRTRRPCPGRRGRLASTSVTMESMCSSTPILTSDFAALAESFGPNGASGTVPASKSSTLASSGSMRRNSLRSVSGGQLADLAGEFHPGRPAADQGEGQPAPALGRIRRGLRHLEGAEDAPADHQRVRQRSSSRVRAARTRRGRSRTAGRRRRRSGRRKAAGSCRRPAASPAPRAPPRRRRSPPPAGSRRCSCRLNTARSGTAIWPSDRTPGGALVEQRLEEVVRRAVDDGDLDRPVPQAPGRRTGRRNHPRRSPRAGGTMSCRLQLLSLPGRATCPLGSSRSASFGPQLPRGTSAPGPRPSTGSTTRQAASTVCCWANSHRSPVSAAPMSRS